MSHITYTSAPEFTFCYEDTWNGATHSRGRWALVRWVPVDDDEINDVPNLFGMVSEKVGTVADSDDRPRDGKAFVTRSTTAAQALAFARAIDASIVTCVSVEESDFPGWHCSTKRLAPDANARRWGSDFAEARS